MNMLAALGLGIVAIMGTSAIAAARERLVRVPTEVRKKVSEDSFSKKVKTDFAKAL